MKFLLVLLILQFFSIYFGIFAQDEKNAYSLLAEYESDDCSDDTDMIYFWLSSTTIANCTNSTSCVTSDNSSFKKQTICSLNDPPSIPSGFSGSSTFVGSNCQAGAVFHEVSAYRPNTCIKSWGDYIKIPPCKNNKLSSFFCSGDEQCLSCKTNEGAFGEDLDCHNVIDDRGESSYKDFCGQFENDAQQYQIVNYYDSSDCSAKNLNQIGIIILNEGSPCTPTPCMYGLDDVQGYYDVQCGDFPDIPPDFAIVKAFEKDDINCSGFIPNMAAYQIGKCMQDPNSKNKEFMLVECGDEMNFLTKCDNSDCTSGCTPVADFEGIPLGKCSQPATTPKNSRSKHLLLECGTSDSSNNYGISIVVMNFISILYRFL